MKKISFYLIAFNLLYFCVPNLAFSKIWHTVVGATGQAGTGNSVDNPMEISRMLSTSSPANGGDTIYIHGGVYRLGKTLYITVSGSEDNHILVKNAPGEFPSFDGIAEYTLGDGVIEVKGNWVIIEGLRLYNSDTNRVSSISGSRPTDICKTPGMAVSGDNVIVRNMIIHDNVGMATAAWSIGLNVTFYDNIIFNNGWDAPDRGHGHGFYTQNDTTTKEFSNNVVFNNMGNGIQVYGKGSYLSDFIINNNTSFNNGIYRSVSGQELNSQILIGGEVPARGIVLGNNYAYCEHARRSGTAFRIGYMPPNEDIICDGNIGSGGYQTFWVRKWQDIEFTNNIGIGDIEVMKYDSAITVPIYSETFDYNTYYGGNEGAFWGDWDYWQSFGFDLNSTRDTEEENAPTIIKTIPSQQKRNRGTITIFNVNETSVDVDLSSIVDTGAQYYLYDVENLKGDPIHSGRYHGGTVNLPLDLTEAMVINNETQASIHSSQLFACFVVFPYPLDYWGDSEPPALDVPLQKTSGIIIKGFTPNPTRDLLSVEFIAPEDLDVNLRVKDNLKDVLYEEAFNTSKINKGESGIYKYVINLANYSTGVYLIEFEDEEGLVSSLRVIKN